MGGKVKVEPMVEGKVPPSIDRSAADEAKKADDRDRCGYGDCHHYDYCYEKCPACKAIDEIYKLHTGRE